MSPYLQLSLCVQKYKHIVVSVFVTLASSVVPVPIVVAAMEIKSNPGRVIIVMLV